MKRILFLDLDGTVREPVTDAKFINDPHDQKLIDGVKEAIARYRDWTIIGITNQGGVAAGHKSLEDAIIEQGITLKLFPELKCIYFCPDYEGEDCYLITGTNQILYKRSQFHNIHVPGQLLYDSFRKPGSGMIMLAIDHLDFYPDEVLMVGDRSEDKEAASAAGIGFMWAEDWRL